MSLKRRHQTQCKVSFTSIRHVIIQITRAFWGIPDRRETPFFLLLRVFLNREDCAPSWGGTLGYWNIGILGRSVTMSGAWN